MKYLLIALLFVSGCGTFNGIVLDIKAGATALSNQTQKWAEQERDWQQNEEKRPTTQTASR